MRTPAGWTQQGKAAVFPGGRLGICILPGLVVTPGSQPPLSGPQRTWIGSRIQPQSCGALSPAHGLEQGWPW